MKSALLFCLCIFAVHAASAQDVSHLPAGTYKAQLQDQTPWEKGNIIIIDEGRYQLGAGLTGDYKFSAAAQRIFFISGPLKSAFAKVMLQGKQPLIILPREENTGMGISKDIMARKQ